MRGILSGLAVAGFLLAALTGCDKPVKAPSYFADANPEKLSDWGMVTIDDHRLRLGTGVTPYDLTTPLFTDYAGKLRTVWMPKGAPATYDPVNAFDFPVGTVISKTFYYPLAKGPGKAEGAVLPAVGNDTQSGADGLDLSAVRLVETRLLIRREAGWQALPYIWNEAQTEAVLTRTGAIIPMTMAHDDRAEAFNYVVPNVNQCASCHTPNYASRAISPIGLKARHLNRPFPYVGGAENQLTHLAALGYLTAAPAPDNAPRNADWKDPAAPIEARARAYLDINCGHCHNASGLARTTGLHLDATVTEPRRLGLCKPPTAAGPGTGNHFFDIVPGHADDSILPFRVGSTTPGMMMPELGRSLVHREGLDLIRQWINGLPGNCQAE